MNILTIALSLDDPRATAVLAALAGNNSPIIETTARVEEVKAVEEIKPKTKRKAKAKVEIVEVGETVEVNEEVEAADSKSIPTVEAVISAVKAFSANRSKPEAIAILKEHGCAGLGSLSSLEGPALKKLFDSLI